MIWFILSVILLWLAVVMWSLIEGYKREEKEDEVWLSTFGLGKDKEK